MSIALVLPADAAPSTCLGRSSVAIRVFSFFGLAATAPRFDLTSGDPPTYVANRGEACAKQAWERGKGCKEYMLETFHRNLAGGKPAQESLTSTWK